MFLRRHCCDRRGTPIWTNSSRSPDRRRAFTIVELIGTLILLGVVFTVSISVLVAVARERKNTSQRQHALQHANSLLEHATASNWSDLAVGVQEIPPASSDLQALLPGIDQRFEVSEPGVDRSKQLTVSIRWKNQQGQAVTPIQLVAWVYPSEEPQP
ncbi:MAG: prepilin-type cleavage/methylation protein [Schlesneria sp.]|nr:prepilin-type cleavage/methylation protein [Schlesneria sp.]